MVELQQNNNFENVVQQNKLSFQCEFCDIIVLYGRKPRTKTPQQLISELECLYDLGWRRTIFLVDDNFIGNKRNVKLLLKELQPSYQDALRTSVEHTAHQIALATQRLNIRDQKMLVSGGGAHNTFLMMRLQQMLKERSNIELASDISSNIIDYKEAIIFAFLGLYTLLGKPNMLEKATGVPYPVVGGAIHLPPKGFHSIL